MWLDRASIQTLEVVQNIGISTMLLNVPPMSKSTRWTLFRARLDVRGIRRPDFRC